MTYLVSRHARHVRPFGVPPFLSPFSRLASELDGWLPGRSLLPLALLALAPAVLQGAPFPWATMCVLTASLTLAGWKTSSSRPVSSMVTAESLPPWALVSGAFLPPKDLSNFINARGGGRHTTRAPPPTQAHTRTRDKHPSADANYLPNPREQASQPPGFARQTSAVASGTPSCTDGQPALVTVRRIQGPVSRKEWHVSSAPRARGTPQCSRSEP